MSTRWSEGFGRLEFLPRDEYLRDDWCYVCTEELDDGQEYDIVRNRDGSDWRYTII